MLLDLNFKKENSIMNRNNYYKEIIKPVIFSMNYLRNTDSNLFKRMVS